MNMAAAQFAAPPSLDAVADVLDVHLRLDAAVDHTLAELIANTESSAVASIQQVRRLYDSATQLGAVIGGSGDGAEDAGADIESNLARLAKTAAFIEQLPARMRRDLHSAEVVVNEIGELSELVADVQSISMQSHMLAINTAIQASHFGAEGAAFRVMSDEMRVLAAHSKTVAKRIIDGLGRARRVVEEGMALSIAESAQDLDKVSDAALVIERLRAELENMSRQFKARLATVARHNEGLVKDIEEILGHIQYQDIVRQSIERIRDVIRARNQRLTTSILEDHCSAADLAEMPRQLELILDDYVAGEMNHTHAALHVAGAQGPPKIELF
jgi:methyl-accepting chemotaxis protein